MLKPEFSGQFKRDYKLAVKRGCDPKKLETVITMLCAEQPLPAEFRDHALTNSRNYKGMRECHIQPDWLLVYRVRHEILVLQLIRTGTHSDMFLPFFSKRKNLQSITHKKQTSIVCFLLYALLFSKAFVFRSAARKVFCASRSVGKTGSRKSNAA